METSLNHNELVSSDASLTLHYYSDFNKDDEELRMFNVCGESNVQKKYVRCE